MENLVAKQGKSTLAILAAAKTLFTKYGIVKVTVEEICKLADVSKMTFYRNFENKIDVAKKVMVAIAEKGVNEYRKIMDSDISFNHKIRRIVKMKHDQSENFSVEFVQDIYGTEEPQLRNILEKYRSEALEAFKEDLKIAQEKGEIRKDLKLEFVMYWLQSLNEKMMDKRLTSMFDNTQELAVELTNFIFYGVMPKKNR